MGPDPKPVQIFDLVKVHISGSWENFLCGCVPANVAGKDCNVNKLRFIVLKLFLSFPRNMHFFH